MKTSSILIAFFAVVVMIGGGLASSYIGAVNKGAMYEANVIKFEKASMTALSAHTLTVQEAAQVPDKYMDGLRNVIQDTFNGRYGDNGSQATFQWIQEQNIPVDSSVFTRIHDIITAGRTEFKLSQDRKTEFCAQYETELNSFWSGLWLRVAGYPKAGLEKRCQVVVDSSTTDKFNTGIDAAVKL